MFASDFRKKKKYINGKFHLNPSSGKLVAALGQADAHDDAKSLIATWQMRLKAAHYLNQ
jgi:hypothetical protein